MQSNLKTAILEFLANEFKLEPDAVSPDLAFVTDLHLDPSEVVDLFARLQEALDFELPEDKIPQIQTVEDLLHTVDPDLDFETA